MRTRCSGRNGFTGCLQVVSIARERTRNASGGTCLWEDSPSTRHAGVYCSPNAVSMKRISAESTTDLLMGFHRMSQVESNPLEAELMRIVVSVMGCVVRWLIARSAPPRPTTMPRPRAARNGRQATRALVDEQPDHARLAGAPRPRQRAAAPPRPLPGQRAGSELGRRQHRRRPLSLHGHGGPAHRTGRLPRRDARHPAAGDAADHARGPAVGRREGRRAGVRAGRRPTWTPSSSAPAST